MTHSEKEDSSLDHKPADAKQRTLLKRRLLWAVPVTLVVVLGLITSYLFAVSPAVIRNPKMEHLHFRLQVMIEGQAIDFSRPIFQQSYAKGQCSGELAAEPIHFHDQKNQFVHIHWAKMTGGLVLKNYGWNFIGGNKNVLGYRLDDLPRIKRVPIHGQDLPALPKNATLWVYAGQQNGYQQRTIEEFTEQDLETFFDKQSNLPKTAQNSGFFAWLFPRASAHNGEIHGDTTVHEPDEERLSRINNLIGNVVIFVQPTEPSDAQIKARFADLEPLSESTCGG